MEQLIFEKDTTHLVVKFDVKSKNDKTTIDLVPVAWVFQTENKLYCKFPSKKKDYCTLNEMCKTSAAHGAFWKSYGISVIKQARNFNQGMRRMEKAFSETVVQSSNIDEYISSEVEEDYLKLNKSDIKRCLKSIPSFNKNHDVDDGELNAGEKDSVHSEVDLQQNLVSDSDVSSALSSTPLRHKKKSFKRSGKSAVAYDTTSSSSSTTSSPKINKSLPSAKTKIIGIKKKIQSRVQPTSSNIIGKKIHIQGNYCPTCGAAATESSVIQSNIESAKRSILYSIREEAKLTRALISTNSNNDLIGQIMQDDIIGLPKLNLESFQVFDEQLKTDVDLIKKLKCFMAINIKGSVKLSDNLTVVIPQIMAKSVQVLYSAFGRETNGISKLNFSATETYKHLLEALTTKFEDVKSKEIASQLSRWFSGAKDREGGKKERLLKKIKLSEIK